MQQHVAQAVVPQIAAPANPNNWYQDTIQYYQTLYMAVQAGGQGLDLVGVDVGVMDTFGSWLETQFQKTCSFCNGYGHEYRECMSLILANRMAAQVGLKSYWGTCKGLAYYRPNVLGAMALRDVA